MHFYTDYSYPAGCEGDGCVYRATWTLNNETDIISFTVRAKQYPHRWTAIAFGPTAAIT